MGMCCLSNAMLYRINVCITRWLLPEQIIYETKIWHWKLVQGQNVSTTNNVSEGSIATFDSTITRETNGKCFLDCIFFLVLVIPHSKINSCLFTSTCLTEFLQNAKHGNNSFRIRLTYTHGDASQKLQSLLPNEHSRKRKTGFIILALIFWYTTLL